MRKASFVVSKVYQNNKLFDLENKMINRDNCMYPFYLLKKNLKDSQIDLSTQDINTIQESDFVIYNDMPVQMPEKEDINKSYLLIFESELIRPDNWDLEKHKYFYKIFTWNDDIVDNKKYFKFNFAQNISKEINKNLTKKEKLCTLIAGNKSNSHPLELYSKRIEAIRWFEQNHIDDFEFYGIGWDKYNSSNKYINYILTKFNLAKLLSPNYPSYKGKIDNKKDTLEKYKFVICYENAKDIPGYITEKIFDCFFAGTIPVYWGPDNIEQHIPKSCFIDKREFDDYKELYEFMINIDDEKYLEYIKNIEKYLNSDSCYRFSSEFFAKTIIENILKV